MSLTLLLLTLAAAAQSGAQRPAAAKPKPAPSSGSAVTAFVNVVVVPMDSDRVLTGQTVVVRGTTIAALGPSAHVTVPAGATRIDGQGKYLMPGLGDMHVHFFSAEDFGRLFDWYVEPRLACYLANGVTTLRVMNVDTSARELFQKVATGELVGPRVYPAGSLTPADGSFFPDSLPQRIAVLKASGYKFATVSGPVTSINSNSSSFDSLLTAARRNGLGLVGDVPRETGLDGALQAPYASIEQLQGYLEQLIPLTLGGVSLATHILDSRVREATATPTLDRAKLASLVAATQKAGVWNVPAQATAERMVELWSGPTAAEESIVLKLRRKVIKALHDAGAGLLLGSDAPTWGSHYGFGVHDELRALVGAGLTPYQALATGTRNVATFLGNADSAGTVAPGKWADLVLLNENPLADVRHAAKPAGVMLHGRWLPRTKLDAKLNVQNCRGR